MVSLTIPAEPELMHVLRAVAARVAAYLDFSYDEIEDLRLAVDETCSYLLTGQSRATALTLELAPVDRGVEVVASIDAAPANGEGAGAQPWVWQILNVLTDGAQLEERREGAAIRFVKRRLV